MAVTGYDGLLAAVNAFQERDYDASQLDTFVGLWESKLNRRLGPNYRREITATLTTDASGQAALPADFLGIRSLTRNVAGSLPLNAVSGTALTALNPYGESGEPAGFAISGNTLSVGPIAEDGFTLVYWAKLTGLSVSNQTNWLITAAPDVYFWGVMAQASAYEENWDVAAGQELRATDMLDELLAQSVVGQFGSTGVYLDMVTP